MNSKTVKPVFITQDPAMQNLYQNVKLVARSHAPVIITGESGTGKEVLARLLHYHSPRSGNPFVALNCGALPEDIVESELFGHEKGSFTGAVNGKKGCFEQADKGILFLDEVGETSLQIQVKLLRAVELKNFRRVGGTEEIQTDVQIITATNRDVTELMNSGGFREDLYYRLSVIELHIPPLRDRRGDIPLLSEYFLSKFLQEHDLPARQFAEDFMTHLMHYDWPGNVRELRNVIERCAIMCTDPVIQTKHLPNTIGDTDSDPIAMNTGNHQRKSTPADHGKSTRSGMQEQTGGDSSVNSGNRNLTAGTNGHHTADYSHMVVKNGNNSGISGKTDANVSTDNTGFDKPYHNMNQPDTAFNKHINGSMESNGKATIRNLAGQGNRNPDDSNKKMEALTIPIGSSMEYAERLIISRTLSYTDNNISEAARVLGVSRNTLHNKLSRFNMSTDM